MQPAENTTEQDRRDGRGHFIPGASGNPRGRPAVAAEIRDLARKHGPYAIARLVELSRSKNGGVAVNACRTLLDRGYGRAEQAVTITAAPQFDGEAVTVSNPVVSADVYARVMRGELSADAVRFESAALPAPAVASEPARQPREEVGPDTSSVAPAQPEDPRIAPINTEAHLMKTWGRL